jgi:hypothetical protein
VHVFVSLRYHGKASLCYTCMMGVRRFDRLVLRCQHRPPSGWRAIEHPDLAHVKLSLPMPNNVAGSPPARFRPKTSSSSPIAMLQLDDEALPMKDGAQSRGSVKSHTRI